MATVTIPARQGAGLQLARGQTLRVIDPEGGQSGDLVAMRLGDATEWLSNGRSFDCGGKVKFSTGDDRGGEALGAGGVAEDAHALAPLASYPR